MGVFDELALSGVDRVERSLGPRAALRALVPLLDTLPAGRGRARALLRAIVYAAEVGDDGLLDSLCARWPADGVANEARAAIRRLLRARPSAAVRLAKAELERASTPEEQARASYVLGRCLEAAGGLEQALEAHARARSLASDQPRLRQSAAAREVRALLATGRREEAAHRAAGLLPLERAEPEDRLAVAVAALEASGRYRRAAALDVLEQLARAGGELGRDAVRFAAWHAERAGSALSRIEADRVEAVLAHHPEGELARAQLAALRAGAFEPGPLLARAKAVAEGNAAGPRVDGSAREVVGWLALAACAALRSESRADAREHLRELTTQLRRGARVEAPIWTASILALRDARLAAEGRELAAALLDRAGEPPPRGYAHFAEALERGEAPELARKAWRRAAARREPGARERLARLLRWEGWRAAEAGERDAAIALLEEARRWSGRAGR